MMPPFSLDFLQPLGPHGSGPNREFVFITLPFLDWEIPSVGFRVAAFDAASQET